MALKRNTQEDEVVNDIKQHAIDAVDKISHAEDNATRTIALAAGDAKKVVADAAAVSAREWSLKNSGDHDLLIRLETQMGFISNAIKELKDGTVARIELLERDKAEKKEVIDLLTIAEDNKKRIRSLEDKSSNSNLTIGLFVSLILFLGGLLVYHIINSQIQIPTITH
jgi:hypothetical protein